MLLMLQIHLQNGLVSCLERIALVLNINPGQNQKLMKRCRRLYEYTFSEGCKRCGDGRIQPCYQGMTEQAGSTKKSL